MTARASTAESQPARPFDAVASALHDTALSLRRLLTGEVTPAPTSRRLRSVETPGGTSPTAAIAMLRIWCVGEVPDVLSQGVHVSAVPSVDALASRLAVERAPDVIVVCTPSEADALSRVTSRPVVVEGPELRPRVRLAAAAALARQIGGRGG